MTLSDELRALARKAMLAAPEFMASELCALADRLQGKVVVMPEIEERERGGFRGRCGSVVVRGATEAEAIANLQAALDAAKGGG